MLNFLLFMLFVTFVVVAIIVMLQSSSERKKAEGISRKCSDLRELAVENFPKYRNMPYTGGDSLVVLMHAEDRTALVASGDGFAKELSFDDFISIDILTDGFSVASTQKRGALGRAALGGALTGGAGAVIGALTAKSVTTTSELTTSISVQVTTSDPAYPLMNFTIWEPHGIMQDLKSYEVWPHMDRATDFYNSFSPVFTRAATEQNGLVALSA